MLKRLSLFCVCLIMFSTLVVAFHHHDDGCDHDDCPVCMASLYHAPAEVPTPAPIVQPFFDRTVFFTPTTIGVIAETFFSPVGSRAPPT